MNADKSNRWRAALLALAVATLACSALGGGGATETPPKPRVPTQTAKAEATAAVVVAEATATQTPKPTQTRPTALPSPTSPPSPGDVIYATDFDDLKDWTTIFAVPEPKTPDYIAEIRKGKLYIQVDLRGTTVYAFYDFDLGQPDVQIDADVETVAGPNRNNISLVCRATSDGWYEFSMNSGGRWIIWRYDPKGRYGEKGIISMAEGFSRAINLQKAKNHLTAVCQGDMLTLYVNDVEVGSFTDNAFSEGLIGVSVSTFDIKGAGVEFDDVAVSIPK